MTSEHPHKYGLMAMVSKKDYKYLKKYKKQLDPYVRFYMKPKRFNDIAPQHISLCYFSYPEKYSEDYIKTLIPKIIEIAKKYMPVKVSIKGLQGGWELGWSFPVILWNIQDYSKLNRFHEEIINELKKAIEHFNDPEFKIDLHIGIALIKEESIEDVKKLIEKSRKDNEFEITLDSLEIFFPSGPKKIYPL